VINLGAPPTLGTVSVISNFKERQLFTQAPQWHMLILARFAGEIAVNGRTHPFEQDSFLIVPPRGLIQIHRHGPEDSIYFLNFSPNPEATAPYAFSVVRPYQQEMAVVDSWLRRSFDRLAFERSTICNLVWTLLIQAGEDVSDWQEHTALVRMRRFVDQNLDRAFTMSELAEASGVSQNHLIRLCRAELNSTPQQYCRQTRMSRASELLMSSPGTIKEVAHQVGIPDLHRFNKLIRETFGVSPRQLRNERHLSDTYREYTRPGAPEP